MNSKLLKCIFIIVAMGLLNTACKKSDSVPVITYTTLKVLEAKTNLPIAGAQVRIYECKKHGFGGCIELSSPTIATTDKDGNFQFDSRLDAFFAEASQGKYWTGASGGEDMWGNPQLVTNIFLNPVAYTNIHIRKIHPHPSGLLMAVHVQPDISTIFGPVTMFNIPTDTTFAIESYGNMNSTLSWYFLDGMGNVDSTQTGGQLPSYYINRFDTVSAEINY